MLEFNQINKCYVNPKLKQIEDKHNLLLIGFPVTDTLSLSSFKQLWAKYDNTNKAVGRDEKNTRKAESNVVGGCITLIDLCLDSPADSEILAEIDIMTPRGIFFNNERNELLVGSAFDVKVVKNGNIIKTINNNLFNSVHAIKASNRGVYVVSAATDSIVEISSSYDKVLWDWIATENGYNIAPSGELISVDRKKDYSKVGDIGTRHHTTHVNGVEEYDDENILATLFHQDQLVKINKKTNKLEVVFEDLINPHAIHKYQDGFIISDTRGNRAIILDREFNVKGIITGNFDWIQDTIEIDGKVILLNDNKGRLEIHSSEYILEKQVSWNCDTRMSNCLYKLNAQQAKQVFLPNN